jgi:uncharacterized membrane protein
MNQVNAQSITGDAMVGSALALVEPARNTVAYYFHEKLWKRIDRRHPVRGFEPPVTCDRIWH